MAKGKTQSRISPAAISFGVCALVVCLGVLFFVTEDPRAARAPRSPQQQEQSGVPKSTDPLMQQYEALCKEAESKLEPKGAEDFEAAKRLYEQAVELIPAHPLAHFNLGRVYEELDDHEKALELYSHVLGMVTGRQEAEKTVHTNLALVLMNMNNVTGSIHHWEQAVKIGPKDAMLRFSLANALGLVGDQEGALNHYKRAAELDKKEAKYAVEYGRQLLALGQVEEGNKFFNKGIQGGNEQQLFQLGMYLRQKDREAAERIFEAIIDRFPDHPALASVMYFLGMIYRAKEMRTEESDLYKFGVDQGVFPSIHQRPMFRFPKLLASTAYPDAAGLGLTEVVDLLEQSSVDIARELQPLIENPDELPADAESLARPADSWHQLSFIRNGVISATAAAPYPKTAAVLAAIHANHARDMPRGAAELSLLKSGGFIDAHCGPVNYRVRLHLGLVIPADSGMKVADETRTWQVGKVTILDDSFEHEVWNNGPGTRAVLIVDVWNPTLTEEDRQLIRHQFSWSAGSALRLGMGH